mgnify:CR=1 FL=1
MRKKFRFCILCVLIFLFNTLIAKAEREIKYIDSEIRNGIIYSKNEKIPYNGLIKDYYKNGNVKIEWTIVNGAQNGVAKSYYEDGTLKSELIFKNKCGKDINADLSAIKSKIPEEIFKKLEQRIYGKNIKEIFQ